MRRTRVVDAASAVAAGVVFVGVFLGEDALRPGRDAASTFVSELSLGPFGWVQRLSFVAAGVLLFRGARVVAPFDPVPRRTRFLRGVLRVMGVCLAGSAAFDTDPSALFTQRTAAGVVHGLLGATVFLGMPTSCVLAATGASAARTPFRRATWAVAALLVAGIAVLKLAELSPPPLADVKGLVQRAVLVLWFGWLAVFAVLRPAHA